MCTYLCNISEFINYSMCRMGKTVIHLLLSHFFLPPQAKQLEMTVFIILGSMEMDRSLIETQIRVANATEKLTKNHSIPYVSQNVCVIVFRAFY